MSGGENPSQQPTTPTTPWRRALKTAVAALLAEVGYQAADVMALETLLELIQAYIFEVGHSSAALAELSGRTLVTPSDTVLAIIESGVDIQGIPAYARRENKSVLMPLLQSAPSGSSKILQVGDKRKHPSHIPDYLPPFPDPHTYIRTSAFRQPANEYQVVRERAASQKRDVEVGLTRFIAKTGSTQSLFKDDKLAFPLIACKPSPVPYLSAILPNDYDFDAEEGKESEAKLSAPSKNTEQSNTDRTNGLDDSTAENDTIDNPYLCPVKMAKKNRR